MEVSIEAIWITLSIAVITGLLYSVFECRNNLSSNKGVMR